MASRTITCGLTLLCWLWAAPIVTVAAAAPAKGPVAATASGLPSDAPGKAKCQTSVKPLQSMCGTLLECQLSSTGEAGDGRLATWLRERSDADRRRACDQASLCFEHARQMCSRDPEVTAGDNGPVQRQILLPGNWKRREWIAELASCAQEEGPNAHCRFSGEGYTLPNPLRQPAAMARSDAAMQKLQAALELTRQIYRVRCESPAACMRVVGQYSNQLQADAGRDSTAQAIARDTQQINSAGYSMLEERLNAQAQAVHAHAQQLEQHGRALAEAQQIGALTVAGAMLESLIGKSPATSAQASANLTDATHYFADASWQIGLDLDLGLRAIADAILLASMGQRANTEGVPRQVDPEAELHLLYPRAARFSHAIVLVPDPRIPRHRRGYDLSLAAISQGMLEAGFVLDRYAMPWQKYLDDLGKDPGRIAMESQGGDDGKYGVLIYRKDVFRSGSSGPSAGSELRILYVVAESGTYGVQQRAFGRALLRVERVVMERGNDGPDPDSAVHRNGFESAVFERLQYRAEGYAGSGGEEVWQQQMPDSRLEQTATLVVGPNFSGSMASLQEARQWALADLPRGGLTSASDLLLMRKAVLELVHDEHQVSDPRLLREFGRARQEVVRRHSQLAGLGKFSGSGLMELAEPVDQLLEKFKELEKQGVLKQAPHEGLLLKRWKKLRELIATQRSWANVSTRFPLQLVSASVTAKSNFRLDEEGFRVVSLAVPDSVKLDYLNQRITPDCVQGPCSTRDVVIFSEASTFGSGLCASSEEKAKEKVPLFCTRAFEIRFPANIADVRVSARGRQRESRNQALNTLGLPAEQNMLDLAEGQENGSEFPDSQRSALTTASAERELNRALLQVQGLRPRMIVVAATDVRDRLFLFDRLRQAAPRALLVDLEVDILMAHPSIIHATRGTLLLSSGRLETPWTSPQQSSESSLRVESFINDDQWALHQIFSRLGKEPAAATNCANHAGDDLEGACLYGYTPTRDGLNLVSADRALRSDAGGPLQWQPQEANVSHRMRWAMVLLVPMCVLLLVMFNTRHSRNTELVARVHPHDAVDFPPYVLVLAALALAITLRVSYQSPVGAVSSPYLMALSTGFSWGSAVIVLACAVVCLLVFGARMRHLSAFRVGLADLEDKQRPLLLGNVRHRQRGLGMDAAAWPLLLMVLVWVWLLSGSFNTSVCPGCWPKVGLLGPVAELTLLVGVIALTAVGAWLMWRGADIFRQLLDTARRMAHMVAASGHNELGEWSTLAGNMVLRQHPKFGEAQVDAGDLVGDDKSNDKSVDVSRLVWTRPRFVRTPFLASPGEFAWLLAALRRPDGKACALTEVRSILAGMNHGFQDGLRLRLAAGMYFANLVASIRMNLLMGFLAFAAVVCVGYAYPVTDRDQYLIYSLCAMALAAILLVYIVLALERIPVISRLLCDTRAGLDLNWPLLVSVVTPFILLLGVIFVLEVPGVLEWSGGLLGKIMSWF